MISEDVYELAEKEERRKLRREKAELRKLIPVEVSITPTQLRSRGNRGERVRYNYDEIYEAEEDEDEDDEEHDFVEAEDDDDFEEEEELEPEVRRSARKVASPLVEKPTRWSSRLNNNTPMDSQPIEESLEKMEDMMIDSQKVNTMSEAMDATPSIVDMDTIANISNMDTTPGSGALEMSEARIIADQESGRQQSAMDQ